MGWLKRTSNKIVLYHSSDAPYFENDKYVLLCGNNSFTEEKDDSSNWLSLYANKSLVKKRFANCWKLIEFPYKLPTDKKIDIQNTKLSSKLGRYYNNRIGIVKSKYLENIDEKEICRLFSKYEVSFLLSREAVSGDKIRLADELSTEYIICGKSWYMALLKILDCLCLDKNRSPGWQTKIPNVAFEIYGIKTFRELDHLKSVIEELDLSEKVDLILK